MFTIATRTKEDSRAKAYSHPRFTMQECDEMEEVRAFIRFVCEAQGRRVVFYDDIYAMDERGQEYFICDDKIVYCSECGIVLNIEDYQLCDSCMMQAKFASTVYCGDDDEA
jgi:hypothetical protein